MRAALHNDEFVPAEIAVHLTHDRSVPCETAANILSTAEAFHERREIKS